MKHRIPGVTAAVLLAHAGMVWLVVHQLTSPTLPGASDLVILASVVTELPAPTTRPMQAAAARPALPRPTQPPTPHPAEHPRLASESSTAPGTQASSTSAAPATTPTGFTTTSPNATAASENTRPAPTAAATVVLPSSDADYLHNPPPAYPRMSRRMGEQGTVLVRVFISADGRAEKADIRSSSGYPRLDEAALETVQRWRYVPGQRAGLPEAMWFIVPIRFVLD